MQSPVKIYCPSIPGPLAGAQEIGERHYVPRLLFETDDDFRSDKKVIKMLVDQIVLTINKI
jgi:hypothetical protein